MEPVQISNPEVISLTFTIIKLLLGGILLGLLFYFSKYALSIFPGDIANNKTLNRFILFTKLASWSVFIIYAVEQIFYNYPLAGRIATVILLFMVIGISWQIIREFILGVLIKFEGSYPINRRVKIKKIEGKIKSLGSRHMVVETEKGESLRIPYSLIQKNLQFRSQSDSIFKSHTFELELPNSTLFEEYHRIISTVLCNCHWVSLTKDPIINLIKEDQDVLRLQITTYPVDEKHKLTIENLLKSKLAEYSRPQENQSQAVD